MEKAPLTIAHSHARKAAHEFQKPNGSAAAVTEYELAAAEFAKAADNVEDAEALRIIRLLADYHTNIAATIKAGPKTIGHVKVHTDADNNVILNSSRPSQDSTASYTRSTSPSQIRSSKTRTNRDAPTTIAKNLASARGIPGSQQRRGMPVSPTVTAHTVSGSRRVRDLSPSSAAEAARRQLRSGYDTTSGDAVADSAEGQEAGRYTASAGTQDDGVFQRFYSNFEGYLSTLTAPLVFAGFPLTQPTSPQPSAPAAEKPRESKRPKSPQNEPDLNSIFSRSTRRALRDTNAIVAAESFYVVPTSGGTKSYAQMLSHSRHGLDARPSSSADMEEFVDASETPYPTSPQTSRHSMKASALAGRPTPSAGGKVKRNKTQEELELETAQQREIIDNLSKRLLAFETHSQSQRLALAQSMHSVRSASHVGDTKETADDAPPVPTLPKGVSNLSEASSAGQKSSTDPLVVELQASLAALQRDNAKLARENERKGNVISQYREKWEELKASARKKRERDANTASSGQNSAKG